MPAYYDQSPGFSPHHRNHLQSVCVRWSSLIPESTCGTVFSLEALLQALHRRGSWELLCGTCCALCVCYTVTTALPLLPSVSQGPGADIKGPYSVAQAALKLTL